MAEQAKSLNRVPYHSIFVDFFYLLSIMAKLKIKYHKNSSFLFLHFRNICVLNIYYFFNFNCWNIKRILD